MHQAIITLVQAKSRLEQLATGARADRELARRAGALSMEDGATFFREIFPFCDKWYPLGPTQLCQVPLDRTIGLSWRWRPEHVPKEKRSELLTWLTTCTEGTERAQVLWIAPLGLYLAHEGKNRVAFFRSEGVTHYPAFTTPYGYPEPERLRLIQSSGPHGDEWWAVLDQDRITPLRHPEWALPVLTAYGVSTSKGWPADYPSCAALREEIVLRSQMPRRLDDDGSASLLDLQAKAAKDSEIISASLLDLQDVSVRTGWKKAIGGLVGTGLIGSLLAPPPLGMAAFACAGLGAAAMIVALLFTPTLAVPRRRLRQ